MSMEQFDKLIEALGMDFKESHQPSEDEIKKQQEESTKYLLKTLKGMGNHGEK